MSFLTNLLQIMKLFSQLRYDIPSGIIVFFVALPLCLGIALASGAPLFSGIISGVVGGIVVGALSGSALGVSGPAAGLVTIVLANIATLSSWDSFLLVVVIAGFIQLIMGYAKLGTIAYYFPSSVIKGMLVGIGLTIIIKQVPHILGYNFESIKDLDFKLLAPGAILITITSLALLIFWEKFLTNKHKIFKVIPAPLAVVILGIIFFNLFYYEILPFSLKQRHLVEIPVAKNLSDFFGYFQFPDFSQIKNPEIYTMAIILAVVASLETLLSTEACDKLDPQKRLTPANRELKAQGIGNIISGLIGGLPITQVIVRSSANVSFGARTKLSTIIHGITLLIAVISIPKLLNMIPLASLSCVLLVIGYKLANPKIFKQMYELGFEQFFPFVITVLAMLTFDLLKGIAFGMVMAIFYLIINNYRNPFRRLKHKEESSNEYVYKLAEETSFLNRGSILQMLTEIPEGSKLIIDGRGSKFIHHDVIEILKDFKISAKAKNISFILKGIKF